MASSCELVLFGHAGYANRGCEAIVRGTAKILHLAVPQSNVTLISKTPDVDRLTDVENIDSYGKHSAIGRRFSREWWLHIVLRRLLGLPALYYRLTDYDVIEIVKNVDLSISIGGDNYCYDSPHWLYVIDQTVKRSGKQLVLWGCSIEPEDISQNREMQEDLALFDLITPRESITYRALIDVGIDDNVHLHADPAFVMQPEEIDLPEEWETDNVIGVNLSPLILRYQNARGSLKDYVGSLIRYVLDKTNYKIALVPHVLQEGNNDWEVLNELYQQFSHRYKGRLLLFGQDLNSPQTKYIISQCRMFIGARTHSTIAAYSSGVPTLALGYSVKARGIARDIFGSEEGLVLPVQELTHEQQIIQAFEGLCEREDDLREHLKAFMPSYIQSAWDAGKHVRNFCSHECEST